MKTIRIEELKTTVVIDCEDSQCEHVYDIIIDSDVNSQLRHYIEWGINEYIADGHLKKHGV